MNFTIFENKCIMCGKELKSTHRQALGFCCECQKKMRLTDENSEIDEREFGIKLEQFI
jgi:tRNA(Ile2) C34 agmatinyltransferase TiaS